MLRERRLLAGLDPDMEGLEQWMHGEETADEAEVDALAIPVLEVLNRKGPQSSEEVGRELKRDPVLGERAPSTSTIRHTIGTLHDRDWVGVEGQTEIDTWSITEVGQRVLTDHMLGLSPIAFPNSGPSDQPVLAGAR